MKITIPFTLPGMNELIDANRNSRYKGAGLKKYWQHRVEMVIKRKARPLREPVTITWVWIEKDRRRDPDNVTAGGKKIILDALVHVGYLRNDGWGNIQPPMTDGWKVDKNHPRVELYIEEAGDE